MSIADYPLLWDEAILLIPDWGCLCPSSDARWCTALRLEMSLEEAKPCPCECHEEGEEEAS